MGASFFLLCCHYLALAALCVCLKFERVFVSMTTIANGSSAKLKKLPSGKEVSSATPSSQAPSAEIAKLSGGKPDLNHHHLQLDLIKAEIDKTTTELVSVGLYSRRSIDVGQSANQELPLRTISRDSSLDPLLPIRPKVRGGLN